MSVIVYILLITTDTVSKFYLREEKMKKLISILFAAILSVGAFAQTKSRVLVACYSDTGTTEKIAKWIAEETDAATFKVRLKNPYSKADLNWRDSGSAKTLQAVSKGGNWNSGKRFGAGSSRSEVRAWLKTVSNSGLK